MHDQTRSDSEIENREPAVDWEEIFLMLWRQRSKIIAIGLAAVAVSVVLVLNSAVYESNAKLFVRYVQETSAVDALERNVVDVDGQRTRVLNNEVEILTSSDLAEEVAAAIGPERIAASARGSGRLAQIVAKCMAKATVGQDAPQSGPRLARSAEANFKDVLQGFMPWIQNKRGTGRPEAAEPVPAKLAAQLILRGLQANPKKDSSIIQVSYQDSDPELTGKVLDEMIRRYFDKHLEIHRPGGAQFVMEQAELGEQKIREIDDELKRVMNEAGIVSTQESLELVEKQRSQLRADLITLEAELAGAHARTKSLEPLLGAQAWKEESSLKGPAAAVRQAEPSEEDVRSYQMLLDLVAQLRKRNLDLITTFTPKSRLIASNSRRLDAAESQRRELAAKYPSLVAQTSVTREGESSSAVPRVEIDVELANVSALEARKKTLEESSRYYEQYASTLPASIARIRNLERLRQQEEDSLAFLRTTLRKVQEDAALDPSRIPNLTILQHPTPAALVRPSLAKVGLVALIGGLGVGLVVALWIEMFVDRRVKRPEEFGKRLGIPLGLAIPLVAGVSGRRGQVELGGYATTVQDMLAYEWQQRQSRSGPKLVAVTGAGKSTGASTLARSLASAWQAQGENALVMDRQELATAFAELFETNGPSLRRLLRRRTSPCASRDGLSAKQFEQLLSKLRESDCQYIVLDVPLVGPGVPTRAVAGSFDKVLLIASPDRTDCNVLVHAYHELLVAGADVFCILNKVNPAHSRTPFARVEPIRGAVSSLKPPRTAELPSS